MKNKFMLKGGDYPGLTVVGKDRIVFNDEDRNSQSIVIYGNFSDKINYDLSENTFVLNGNM